MAGSGQYQFISEFAQKHIEQGRAEGRMEGRAEALLQVLDHRGFSVDQPLRDRIAAASMAQLDDWLVRAVDASALADIFRDD